MIRYMLHRVRRHRVIISNSSVIRYTCATCGKRWGRNYFTFYM